MQSIARVQTTDRNINQLQQNIIQAVNPMLINPTLNGVILSAVVLTSGDNTIKHGLNRALQGWIIVLNSASATFYDKQSPNSTPELTLVLNTSADTTVSIYVF